MARIQPRTALVPALLALLANTLLQSPAAMAHGGSKEKALGIRVETLAKSTREWDGDTLPAYPRSQPEIQILRITIPAGVTLPLHTHPVINAAVLTKGRLEVQLRGGGRREFGAGEALIEVVNTVHSGRALPGSDVEVIVFYAGTPGTPVTVLTP